MKSLSSLNLNDWYNDPKNHFQSFIVSAGTEFNEPDLFVGNKGECCEFLAEGADKFPSYEDMKEDDENLSWDDYLTAMSEAEDVFIYIYSFPIIGG